MTGPIEPEGVASTVRAALARSTRTRGVTPGYRADLAEAAQSALADLDVHDGATYRSWPVWAFDPPLKPRDRRFKLRHAVNQLVDVVLGVRSEFPVWHGLKVGHGEAFLGVPQRCPLRWHQRSGSADAQPLRAGCRQVAAAVRRRLSVFRGAR